MLDTSLASFDTADEIWLCKSATSDASFIDKLFNSAVVGTPKQVALVRSTEHVPKDTLLSLTVMPPKYKVSGTTGTEIDEELICYI
jgi:hypothetical protein